MSLRSDISNYVAKRLDDHFCDILDRLNKAIKEYSDESRKRTQGIYYAPPLSLRKDIPDSIEEIK